MTADEIRKTLKDFDQSGLPYDEAGGAKLIVIFLAELAAQVATIAEALTKGGVNVTTRQDPN